MVHEATSTASFANRNMGTETDVTPQKSVSVQALVQVPVCHIAVQTTDLGTRSEETEDKKKTKEERVEALKEAEKLKEDVASTVRGRPKRRPTKKCNEN